MGIGTLKRHRERIAAARAATRAAEKQTAAKQQPAQPVEQQPRQAEFAHDDRRRRR